MLNKLVQKKNMILIVCSAVLLIFWTLTLIFGNGEDKMTDLILSLVLPLVIYGFVRFSFKVVRIHASRKFIKFAIYFFFIMGVLGIMQDVIHFITRFPNGFSPTLTYCLGLVIAVLDESKKNIDMENKQKQASFLLTHFKVCYHKIGKAVQKWSFIL